MIPNHYFGYHFLLRLFFFLSTIYVIGPITGRNMINNTITKLYTKCWFDLVLMKKKSIRQISGTTIVRMTSIS